MLALGLFAAVFVGYELAAKRLERAGLTRPIVFVVTGVAVGLTGVLDPLPEGTPGKLILVLAEIALALVLFSDAASVDLRSLRRHVGIPARLLGPGMVLTMVFGTGAALVLLGDLNAWECALLAAILAPTDAALGAAVVTDRRVPGMVRESLNVEAGLNDGLAVPFVLLFAAGASVTEGLEPASFWAITAVEKIGIGALVGIAAGLGAARLIKHGRGLGWSSAGSEQLAMAAFAVALFALTEEIGGSGLIAAFVAGLVAGSRLRGTEEAAIELAEGESALVGAFVFFALGLVAVELFDALTPAIVGYALVSLTVVRMLPVGIALLGTGLRPATSAFIGWFGPRGLASVVLVLIVLEGDRDLHSIETIVLTTVVTVILSVVLHGLSAPPLARRYGASVRRAGAP